MKIFSFNKAFSFSLAVCMLGVGCSKFEDINTNPDKPLDATASLMATQVIWDIAGTEPAGAKTFSYDYQRSKYIGWAEGASNEQYNFFGRGSFEGYTILTTGQKMVAKAEGTPQYESYLGLFKFLKAFKLYGLTMRMGDIPYSEALAGEEGITKPKYDTQKEVFLHILNDLDEAYSHFNNAGSVKFDGDVIYNGDNEKWQRMISGFQLRVLLSLSKKENDTDLQVKDRFKSVVNNQKLFESNEDNFQIVFKNQSGMVYPFHHTMSKHSDYVLMSSVLIDSLKKYEDYRMFYYAAPAQYMVDNQNIPKDSWDAFEGVDVTLPFNEMGALASSYQVSRLNRRYIDREEGEPFAKLRCSDMNFSLAEAALRGWIGGDPNDYYKKGIKADLEFKKAFMVNDEQYHYGRVITDSYINDFLAKPEIQLVGSFENKLNKIITQKYLSNFFQVYELEAYMDYRRTGYPKLPINTKTNMNTETDKIPVRFMYPSSETNYNSDNVEEAIGRQFNGNDEVNQLMWVLK